MYVSYNIIAYIIIMKFQIIMYINQWDKLYACFIIINGTNILGGPANQ